MRQRLEKQDLHPFRTQLGSLPVSFLFLGVSDKSAMAESLFVA